MAESNKLFRERQLSIYPVVQRRRSDRKWGAGDDHLHPFHAGMLGDYFLLLGLQGAPN